MAGPKSIGLPQVPGAQAGEIKGVLEQAEARLLETVDQLRSKQGTGQEQGGEADGPGVNQRRAAISVLMSRHEPAMLAEKLPGKGGKLLKTIQGDLNWLRAAERQPLEPTKSFDFSWSKNPMSTPKVLGALAKKRFAAAKEAAALIEADPNRAHDASNDSLLTHLELEDPALRSQVLADTLIQFRAKRRSEALMDSSLVGAEDPLKEQAEGRFGSSGTVSAFEQRLACALSTDGSELEARREYALTRMVVANATAGSVNGIYLSRNAIAVLPEYMGMGAHADPIDKADGLGHSIFNTIHRNYSANTPKAVDHYLRQRIFSAGPVEDRVEVLGRLLEAARSKDLEAAQTVLSELKTELGHDVPMAGAAKNLAALQKAIIGHIEQHCAIKDLKKGLSIEGKLRAYEILISVHKSVVVDRPGADDLERELFYAGKAAPDVAALILALRKGGHLERVEATGAARRALRLAYFDSSSAFERQMMWRLDRKIELISAEILGTAVERAESANASEVLGETLVAARSALRGVLASGLDAVRARPKTAKTEDLSKLLEEIDAMLAAPSVIAEDLRGLMTRVFQSASEVADTLRGFFHRREAAIHFSDLDVELDPEFSDSLIKESALHYLLSLSQSAMTHGLESKITADEIRVSAGMKVLNSTGPRVYQRVLIAKDPKALKKYSPPPGANDLCVITGGNQNDLVYGGGLILDAKNAGPGYSHASVFAKGHVISAIALPNLSEAVTKFFSKAQANEGVVEHPGFYVDDRPGSFVIKPLQSALDDGLLKVADIERHRPGFNLDVDYYDVDLQGERTLAAHAEHRISDEHSLRRVELFVPDLANKLSLDAPPRFSELADVPLDLVRQNAGEKGAVLVQLAKSEALAKLGVKVPGGAIFPPSMVMDLLKQASAGDQSLYDRWQSTLETPDFAKAEARLGNGKTPGILEQMKATTTKSLKRLLLKGNQATPLGSQLLKALSADPALKGKTPWILRSSFTGEDRPFKSGAGQYSSYPNCVSARQRLEGLIGVIASAWNEGAVESNLASGISLEHVWPSVVVQKCLAPTVSGVAISRGKHGGFGEVAYQAKPKFGGGVDGGAAEEGTVMKDSTSIESKYENKKVSLLTEAQQQKLRAAVLAIEKEFDEQIEPGAHHAVDVEWAFVGDELHILQARVITGV